MTYDRRLVRMDKKQWKKDNEAIMKAAAQHASKSDN
jgi:hypothetical protein